MIKKTRLAITTTGSAGSATGTATTPPINGWIVRVDVNYHASAPATTDLTMVQDTEEVATNIISLTNTNSDTQVFPTIQLTDNTGTGLTYDGTRVRSWFIPVADTLTASIAQADALTDCAVIDIYYEE